MSKEIKPLIPKSTVPPIWTMFLDGTSPPCFSYSRIVGFIVIIVFLSLASYLSITTGTLIVPDQSWVYIIVSFALMKPVQRFAEAKDNATQLNYDFQMAQLDTDGVDGKKPVDNPPQV